VQLIYFYSERNTDYESSEWDLQSVSLPFGSLDPSPPQKGKPARSFCQIFFVRARVDIMEAQMDQGEGTYYWQHLLSSAVTVRNRYLFAPSFIEATS